MGKIGKIKINKVKMIRRIILVAILFTIIVLIISSLVRSKEGQASNTLEVLSESIENPTPTQVVTPKVKKELGWELTLVNQDNKLPDDYEMNLVSIDKYRKFDSRAIKYLNNMINAMKEDGINNAWIQSAYRSVADQERVYNNKVNEYKRQGKSEKEAKRLTELVINKPGYSEHGSGLAIDFNYVKTEFEKTKAFKWLMENAEDYGFILRYPEDKENITKINYEPWHWRYVGEENAKEMNKLGLCLEEYIEYLNN